MDMIDRYVFAVTRRLPTGKRAEVERDLRQRIEEKLREAASADPEKEAPVELILRDLGHPALLADQYRGGAQHLIGPNLFYLYEMVLKIVLLTVAGGLLVAMMIKLLVNGETDPLRSILETGGSLFTGLIGAFIWVTLIFVAIDRFSPELQIQLPWIETFDPLDLPHIPQDKDRIHPAEPIASMVFILIALVAAYYAPDYLGYYSNSVNSGAMIPLFTESVYRMYLPFILLILAIGLAQEIAKLAAGRWTVPLSIFHLLMELPGFILTVLMLNNPKLFNGQLFSALFQVTQSSDPMLLGLPMPLFISRVVIGVAIFGLIVDGLVTLARIWRISAVRSV